MGKNPATLQVFCTSVRKVLEKPCKNVLEKQFTKYNKQSINRSSPIKKSVGLLKYRVFSLVGLFTLMDLPLE